MELPRCFGRSRPRYKRIGNEFRSGRLDIKVCRYHDSKIRSDVAMKTIPFRTKYGGLPSSVLREISVLKELEHENVIRLHDVIYTPEAFNLSFEWLESNLAYMIKEIHYTQRQIKIFLSQILRGVCYCHSQKVLHRDLRPKNLLMDPVTRTLKLADFGFTRTFDASPSEYSVNDMGVSAYKAPELILNMRQSTPAVDMWSVGCIFAELVNREYLLGGVTDYTVMINISRLLGVPSENEWPGVTEALTCLGVKDRISRHPLQELAKAVPRLDESGIDLLSKMLCFIPERRISARVALEHPYFKD